jgi:hypothetical protein
MSLDEEEAGLLGQTLAWKTVRVLSLRLPCI